MKRVAILILLLILATGFRAENIDFDGKLIDCFDFSPQNLIEVATDNQLFLLGSDTLITHGKMSSIGILSFAYLPDSSLMIVRDGEVSTFDAGGNVVKIIGLPFKKMGISSGKHVFYIYERSESKKNQALYMFARNGRYQKLFDIPAFINDLIEIDKSILFATDEGIFEFSFLTRKFNALVKSPIGKSVISVAYDEIGKQIYYSTDQAVYTLYNGLSMIITDAVGGKLRYNDGLFVFNPAQKVLLRLTGLNAITNLKLSEIERLKKIKEKGVGDNALIIDLVEKKYSEDKIIYAISELRGNYDLSVDTMISLSERGISPKIIMAMKNAMKRK